MRARIPLPFGAWIKRFMPRSLLGRTLLIMLVPLVLVQVVALQIFYGSHLGIVSRRLSSAIAGEISYTVELLREFPTADREWVLQTARDQFTLGITLEPGATLARRKRINILGPMDDDLAAALTEQIRHAFHHGLDVRPPLRADPPAIAGWCAGCGGAAQAPGDRHHLPVRRLAGWVRLVPVLHRRAVHAQPGARNPPSGPVGGGVRHGP